MNALFKISVLFALHLCVVSSSQTVLQVFPDSLLAPVPVAFTPGVFFVPKTAAASSEFSSNGIQHNAIRTHVIEIALNNATDLQGCLSIISSVQSDLQVLSQKCEKLIFIFEKMPVWLSSSSDGSPAATPGWYVLNTKPPANWNTWQTVVDSITSKIVNQFGISNAYFEVWNEPDLGSWTGTMSEYFTLYRRTYDGVKSASPGAKVGGPAVNFWSNNINWQAPYGYISDTQADSSLIGQLIDSSIIWNKVPDFITWHNFNLTYQEFARATAYIQQKTASHNLPSIPLLISEWNASSQVRDTPLATSFMLKATLEFSKTTIANHVIAAWQDFTSSTNEFHNDYGLLTYGSIHKPAYYSVLFANMMKGTSCKLVASHPFDGAASVVNDTVFLLVSNYCPPAFVEAFNHTLYQGQFNANQLDSAGYIDITNGDVSYLDSIYRALISIPNSSGLNSAINNAIPIYAHYDSIYTTPRSFNLTLNGFSGNYAAQLFIIDSTRNNMQFRYDSLRNAGYTQSAAIAAITAGQSITFSNTIMNSGQLQFSLAPNSVCIIKCVVPGVTSVLSNDLQVGNYRIYPNPANTCLNIASTSNDLQDGGIVIFDIRGTPVKTANIEQSHTAIDISALANGMYFIYIQNNPHEVIKFVKH